MNATSVKKTSCQRMALPTLKAFLYIVFPVAILGMVMVVISKIEKGIWNTGTFGLPNVVSVFCCILSSGFMAYAMFKYWQELRSRKETSNQPDAVVGK